MESLHNIYICISRLTEEFDVYMGNQETIYNTIKLHDTLKLTNYINGEKSDGFFLKITEGMGLTSPNNKLKHSA